MFMQKLSLTQRIRNRLSGNNSEAKAALALKKYLDAEGNRAEIYPSPMQYNVIEPEYNYEILDKWAKYNSVLRTVHEALIKEATRNGGEVKPRWMSKCPACSTEFQTEKEKCPDCEAETIKPDINQKSVLEAFIKDPNAVDEIQDIQISNFRYMLSVSDWYLSIQKADYTRLKPLTIYVEDSTKMRCVADNHGNLGNDEYFCPRCVSTFPSESYKEDGRCTHCGNTELKETAYIYMDGAIKARWAKDEIVHGKLDPNLPSLYGLPKEVSLLTVLSTLQAMDQFNLDTYTEGKLGNIIVFEGLNQQETNELAVKSKEQMGKKEWSTTQGTWIVKKLKTLLLGSGGKGGVTNVPAMPELEKMQSLDWWKLWRELVGAVYGAQDVSTGAMKEGTTGQNPRMKADFNNNTVEGLQKAWYDPFNNSLCPLLGVTDWIYAPNALEEKDEAQDMAILQAKLIAIQTAISLGFDAELTDEQEVKISGKPLSLEEKQQRAIEQQQKLAESAPNDANPSFEGKKPFKKEDAFATEKAKRWVVTEIPNHTEVHKHE